MIKSLEFINMDDTGDLCLDRISSLPAPIIDTILCLLPIKLAVRTSVLSREWRYNWTRITVLCFYKNEFKGSTTAAGTDLLSILERSFDLSCPARMMIRMFKFFTAIKECLKLHHGPLLEFYLFANTDKDCVELDEIIRLVSRRGDTVKLFQLNLNENSMYRLPSSLFALHQLTNLCLDYGCIYHQPTTFNGFPRLTYLSLHHVKISIKSLLHLLSSCPLLEILTLNLNEDDILGNDKSSITELIECLPAIQSLHIGSVFHCFSVDSLSQELPMSLVGLENLHIQDMSFLDSIGLPSFSRLIQCSPKLKILTLISYDLPDENEPITLNKYSNIWLKNLSEFEIYGIIDFDLKLHLEFAQLIMAKSPMLKKVGIWLCEDVTDDELSNISRLLLNSPRASGSAKITVGRHLNE
ncbi:F-box/FBD/LRR-repeat protein At1g13570-like [Rutidosis leptorrhynchoides]|uniref:F-box/FBD/LRR-repeat protein At1g13570-like n=1 Tax=Rutidosis leptorrhynchoides TaxID=125765 RepID=UPI003A99B118